MEKKCLNCNFIDICIAYHKLSSMAGTLNMIMRENDIGENGFAVMINTMAHDCTRYERLEERK